MNIASWLYQSALSWPERPAVLLGTELHQTYGALLLAVGARARQLTEVFHVEPGDRVAIFAKNSPEMIELFHACWWIGAVIVPINCKLHRSEAAWIAHHSGAKLVFTDSGGAFALDPSIIETEVVPLTPDGKPTGAPLDVSSSDLAWLFYTSGTTGKPKGVMLTHDNLREMSMCYSTDVDAPQEGDHVLYAAPMSHGAGLYMFAHIRTAKTHVVPASRGFDSEEVIDLAQRLGNLVFFAAPTMIKRLIAASHRQGYDGDGIRTIIYGGGPMYAHDIDEALEAFGSRFVQIYGQGETPMTISALSRELVADQTHSRWRQRRSSVGVAQSCVTVAILDAKGRTLPNGQTGEICVKSPTVMRGYWQNTEATADTIKEGWLYTGDLGHVDDDGFLYLTDRSKDVVISGGTNIYPREVEEVLLLHPGVFEVAVIGEKDAEWGERVVAVIVAKPGTIVGVTELDDWCRQAIAAFKRPKRYVFVEELPKNGYGKVVKAELRLTLTNKTVSGTA